MIKDYDYVFKGINEIATELIRGELLSVIVASEKHCNVKITFSGEMYDNIVLLNVYSDGARYIPIKILSKDNHGDIINNCAEHYFINNKLTIFVDNCEATVTLRVRNWIPNILY